MVRRHVKKRARRRVWGEVLYTCECGAGEMVLVCAGVGITRIPSAPAPRVISCFACGGDSIRLDPIVAFSIQLNHPPTGRTYVCVPSRREVARLIERARFEAQLVRPRNSEIFKPARSTINPLDVQTLRKAV